MKYIIDSETIKGLRVQEGLNQREFAEKYNISVRTLQKWEQGRSVPPAYVPYLIGKLNNLEKKDYPSVDELFRGYEKKHCVSEMPSGDLVGKELL